jgi:type III restriction enzyme
MKLKFKVQAYQSTAVQTVVDCFAGQPHTASASYRIDPGRRQQLLEEHGFRNADLRLTPEQVLHNIREVQQRQGLPLSTKLEKNPACQINLDVEMETGTGKTYVYIKTMFELYQRYGWSKFIVVVPSIAIREGVAKSLQLTAEHFGEQYGKKARFFVYNSKQLHQLESFSSDAGINVMIINIQAFNATGKDNRRIYEELDDFQSRRPIDVISSNRPILILDEPQKMEGLKTIEALAKFRPLMTLRYSATHRTTYNKVHRLDALDAYNQKLVKKIAVRGITVKGLAGTSAYLYLENIEISKQAPVARIELEIKQNNGIKRVVRKLEKGHDLFAISNELNQYRGYVIAQIDAVNDTVEFTNGVVIQAGDVVNDQNEEVMRRIQIRESIKAHLDKELVLFPQGIKVLSLFFIDEVAKYRDYDAPDHQGIYARIFAEEYERLRDEYLGMLDLGNGAYQQYLRDIPVTRTHNGYFSIDKKSQRFTDPSVIKRGEEAGLSDDVDAYTLILKDKERLLSFAEPVRFIFSHSALREGWDNPNVFVMCMLKHSDNTISRRQEVGRGLRLCVNQHGERIDHPAVVHDINVLTVVTSESYTEFVGNLQRELSEALASRPRQATAEYFVGKKVATPAGTLTISAEQARQIERYLVQNHYTDEADRIAPAYHDAKRNGTLAPLPERILPHADAVYTLIDSVYSDAQLPKIVDERKPKLNPLNANFHKREFRELWQRINRKAVYRVEFDVSELITKCVPALDAQLRVTPLQYIVQAGEQTAQTSQEDIVAGKAFGLRESRLIQEQISVHSQVRYDLLGKIAEQTQLTRRTVAHILSQIQSQIFVQFKQNPEQFIAEASRIINEQKATVIVQHLTYHMLEDRHDIDIFTASQLKQDFTTASQRLKRHIYDYVVTDSHIEQHFANQLDTSDEVVVYAKLPRGFHIPTPIGDYNPDWAISFKEGSVKHIYFVAETKGSMSSMQLRLIEDMKIACAKRFFADINRMHTTSVTYDVVDSFDKLMSVVAGR